jgi:hypothetical protein
MIRNTGWWAGARAGGKATDYVAAVDVRNAGNYGSYGILFGGSDDWSQFYVFTIDPEGNYWLWKKDGDNWTNFNEGYSTYIKTGTDTNRVKIKRDGSEIVAYVNGKIIAGTTDSSFLGEKYWGLIVFSHDQPNVDARFDNAALYPVECIHAAEKSKISTLLSNFRTINSANSGPMNNQRESMKR